MSRVTYKGGRPVGPQRVKHKSTWWRYLLMWFTGVVSAFIITGIVLAVLGVSFTAKELAGMAGQDISQILQPGYQNYSVLELVTTLSSKKFETLGDIAEVTPLPEKLLNDTINPMLDKELHFQYNWEELKTKPFKLPVDPRTGVDTEEDINTYLGRALKEGVTIESFINTEEAHPLLKLFLYPKDEDGNFIYDNPYTLADYINADDEFFNNIIASIKIKDVVDIDPSDRLLNAIGDWSITQLTQDEIDNLEIGLFLDPDSQNPLIFTLSSWTIGMLSNEDNFKNLKLGDLIEVTDTTPKMLITLISKEYTIGMLETTNLYNVLQVQDVFDCDDNDFLNALKEKYLSDLEDPETILKLKLGEIFTGGDTSIVSKFSDTTLEEITEDGWFSNIKLIDIYTDEDRANNRILDALINNNEEVKFGDLSDPETIQALTLGDILDPDDIAANTVLTALQNYSISELGPAIDSLTLAQVLSEDDIAGNSMLTALKDTPLNGMSEALNNLTVATALGIDTTQEDLEKILAAIGDWKISELEDKLPTLTWGQVMDLSPYPYLSDLENVALKDAEDFIDVIKTKLKLSNIMDIYTEDTIVDGEVHPKSPQILIELKDELLTDIPNKVQALTLSQLIDTSTHPLLEALSGVAILDGEAVLEAINGLKLNQIYTSEQIDGLMQIVWDKYENGNIAITDLPNAMSGLTLVELLADHLYDTSEPQRIIDGVPYYRIKTMWWLLLTESGEHFSNQEMYYVLKNGKTYNIENGLVNCLNNFEYHMSHDSIRTLYEAKFINIDSAYVEKLETTVYYDGQFVKVGDLTIDQLANLCLSLIP